MSGDSRAVLEVGAFACFYLRSPMAILQDRCDVFGGIAVACFAVSGFVEQATQVGALSDDQFLADRIRTMFSQHDLQCTQSTGVLESLALRDEEGVCVRYLPQGVRVTDCIHKGFLCTRS